MSYIPGQPVTAVVDRKRDSLPGAFLLQTTHHSAVCRQTKDTQRVEIHKLRQGENLILGFSIGGGIDQDPTQNPFSEDKTDKGIYVTRVTDGGPAEIAGLQIGDKIMQVNGWDMTMVTHDQARKRLTKRNEEVVRLLVTRHSLQKAVQQSMMS
uniref:Tax1-binding protein 3 n=1 Tax=Sphaerodactylus townsendi TaxID=933632 RepID=A0ACB8ECL8_9SAUR